MILKEPTKVIHQSRSARNAGGSAEEVLPQVGPWRAVARVGCGRFSDVFRATPAAKPHSLEASYILKVLRDRYENIPENVQCFCRAAQVGKRVSHSSIAPVLDVHVMERPYYLVLPWVEGLSLRAHFQDRHQIAIPSLLWVVRQIADALGALYDAGYLHGDIKPENIIVSPDWHATLIDLEFARKVVPDASDPPVPLLGTAPYLAPEIVLSRSAPDVRADIYSLGIVLYEGLTGSSPFQADTPQSLIKSLRCHGVPNLRQVMPHLPRPLAELVCSMTAKEPLRRPQTPHEVVAALVDMEIETFAQRQWE